MKEFDTKWVTLPLPSVLALTIGDANPWVVALALVAGLKFTVKW